MRCNSCGAFVDEKCEICPNCQHPLNNQLGINQQKNAKINKKEVVKHIIITISIFWSICFLIIVLSIVLWIGSLFDTNKKCAESYECTLNKNGENYTCLRDWWINETTEIVCEEDQLETHQFAD